MKARLLTVLTIIAALMSHGPARAQTTTVIPANQGQPISLELEPLKSSLTIGDDYAKENSIVFNIKLTGNGLVRLTLEIPIGENGVLRTGEDANDIQIATPGTVPAPKVLTVSADVKQWALGDSVKGVQVNGATTMSVSISNILCRSSENKSNLTITWRTKDKAMEPQKIVVTKAKPTGALNPILYFVAEPTFLIGRGKVTLSWALAATQKAFLSTPSGGTPTEMTGTFSVDDNNLSATGAYTLKVGGKQRQVTVNVLKAGWQEVFALGRPDRNDKNELGPFPSVIFDPGDRYADALYAIFVRGPTDRRKAELCKSANGITNWEVISTDVPEGMESSPGVLLGNRLWLIGGSAADPDQVSNQIWYYDLGAPTSGWREATVAGFEHGKRMGHACVIVDDKTIWVLGGMGTYGALNDVWRLTIPASGGQAVVAERLSANSQWRPRCMFSAFKHLNMIWICGGVASPNGKPLGDVWFSRASPVSWQETNPPPAWLKNAIATGAATSGSTPFAIVRERVDSSSKHCQFRMTSANSTTVNWDGGDLNPSTFHINGLWDEWRSDAHSVAMVGFQDRLYLRFLHHDALYGEPVVAPIFVYVNK
jgi:Galactose oxidase, central domain